MTPRTVSVKAAHKKGCPNFGKSSMESVGQDAVDVRPTIITGVPRFYEKARARILEFGRALPPMSRRLWPF